MTGQGSGQEERPADLTVARTEAARMIDTQIVQGRKILRPRMQDLGDLHTIERKWSEFNREMLRRIFDNDSMVEEYDWVGVSGVFGSQRMPLGKQIEAKIAKLESIRERLPLIPESLPSKMDGTSSRQPGQLSRKVFVAHGRDDAARESVAALLRQLDLDPVILRELPNRGRAIIEKIEEHSDVAFAVVLLTPDDVGYPGAEPDKPKQRARQNVILELGFFLGLLGRANVCALHKGDIEIPSDYQGVLYVPMDPGEGWKLRLAQEISTAGIEIDLNKLKPR